MEKNEVKVLIVEDDVSFGKALVESFRRSGFGALHAARPDEAISICKMQVIHAFVIDCLLPKTSGVELARQLRETFGPDVPIILTSGIYRDKSFTKDATIKTKALAFFEKPFDTDVLVKKIEESLGGLIDESLDPFLEILLKPATTPLERLKSLPKTIHGFELPRVIGYLMNPAVRGTLTLSEAGDVSSLAFAEGKIVKVQVKDPESYFGAILVEKNFLTAEELELALSTPSQKKIGERLVDANLLSPHVIQLVFAEQMAIRVSKLVKATSYDIQFQEDSSTPTGVVVDQNLILAYFSDWIRSKISMDWLRTFYTPFLENRISRTTLFSLQHPIFNFPPLTLLPFLVTKIQTGTTIQSLVSEHPNDEEKIWGAVHLLVMTGLLGFDKNAKTVDVKSQISRLKRISQDMAYKSYFDILGVTPRSKSTELRRSYHELAKVFHPDKLVPGSPDELAQLTRDVFSKMTVAYETLSDDKKRATYLKELEQGKAEKILQSESLFEEGKLSMKQGNIIKALEKFNDAAALRPATSELILHLLWARLMTLSQSQNQQQALTDIEQGLGKIPPEERHNAIYYFVKGVFQKFIGELELAKRNLEHAVSLSPGFVEAKRELNILKTAQKNKPVDIFKDDLGEVVTSIFKKKR